MTSDLRGCPVRNLRLKLCLEVSDPEHLGRVPILVEELVEGVLDVAVAEEDDRILIAAALLVRLAMSGSGDEAAGRADFLQFTVRAVEPQFTLHHQGDVGAMMPVEHDPLIGRELEHDIDDTVFLIHLVDKEGDVIEPVESAPSDVALVEAMRCHSGSSGLFLGKRRSAHDRLPSLVRDGSWGSAP